MLEYTLQHMVHKTLSEFDLKQIYMITFMVVEKLNQKQGLISLKRT